MSFDPSRLYAILLNTGLQSKDNALYQLLHNLIKAIADINVTTNTLSSGSGGTTITNQIIQSLSGIDIVDSFDEPIIVIPSIQNLSSPFNQGDILVIGPSGIITSIPDVAINSVLISKGVGVIPAWSENVNLGTSNNGVLNISGRLAVVFNLADDGVFAQGITATFPSVITTNRTALNYNIITAGASGFNQTGLAFTMNAGYTGSAHTYALRSITNVATTLNQSVAFEGQAIGAGLSNCAIAGISNSATNGNIGVYGGIGGFTSANFNFNITAAILASNGATGNDIYRGYSSTNLRFSVTDAGNVVAVGSLSGTSHIHTGAEIDKTYTIVVPVTGDTKTMAAGQSRIIFNPAGTLALLTVTLPPSPVDGQVAGMSFTQIITGLTINAPGGATVVAPPTTAAVDSNFRFLYQASSTSWFPCS